MTHTAANVINDAFRAYDDDVAGGIASQTALFAVDTNWTQAVDTKFHVAMLVTETAGGDANSYNYRLEYNLNSGGWTDVSTTTPIQAVTATNCTTSDAASYGTTALTTGATIQATEYDNGGADSAAVSLNNASFEYTTSLQIDSGQVVNNDSIQLRLTNAGTALNADTTIPTITVSESADTTVNTNVEALTIAEQAATIALDVNITSNTQALTITEQQATIALNSDIQTNTRALTIAGQQASIFLDVDVPTNTQALTITGQTATISTQSDTEVTTITEALTLTGQQASISVDVGVTTNTDALVLTGQQSTISLDVGIGTNTQALTITGQAASVTLTSDTNVNAITDALTLSGQQATVSLDVGVTTSTQSLTITGQSATITHLAKEVSCTLVDINGNPKALLADISWAWFDQVDPELMTAPTDQGGAESTDGDGLIEVSIPNSTLTSGQTGTLVLRSDDGSLFGAYNLALA